MGRPLEDEFDEPSEGILLGRMGEWEIGGGESRGWIQVLRR